MSIDPKEWSAKRTKAFYQAGRTSNETWQAETDVLLDLIRAVIADEAAKAQPAELRAEGDVPEWCYVVAKENLSASGIYGHTRDFILDKQAQRIHAAAEPDLTRRVSEATAERDKRIAELETACQEIGNTLSKRIDGLRQQLADATRPVEDVDWDRLWNIPVTLEESDRMGNWLKRIFEPLLQRERAARLAAEQRATTAEELIDEVLYRLGCDGHVAGLTGSSPCWQCDVATKLAAYRSQAAEEGKVPK